MSSDDYLGVSSAPIWSIMEQAEAGQYVLPTIQREFVWTDRHILQFIDAMKRGYPLGMITLWSPSHTYPLEPIQFIDSSSPLHGSLFVLDGQQRITTLLLVKHGFKIKREGNIIERKQLFYDPWEDEVYSRNDKWDDHEISVTDIAVQSNEFLKLVLDLEARGLVTEQERLKKTAYAIRQNQVGLRIVGPKYSYEDVASIFLAINSAGVKIGAIDMFFSILASKFNKTFKDDILNFHRTTSKRTMTSIRTPIRCLAAAMGLNQTSFTASRMKKSIDRLAENREETKTVWSEVKKSLKEAYYLLANRGLENLRLLPNEAVLTPFSYYIHKCGGKMSRRNTDLLFYWLLMASYHGRYSQTVNGRLDQDLLQIRSGKDAKGMVEALRKQVGGLKISRHDFYSLYSKRLLLLMYVLERNRNATDWFGGGLVRSSGLHAHHIFPRKYLSDNDYYDSYYVDDIANITLISSEANSTISSKAPLEYFETESVDSRKLEEHFVPLDKKLWTADNYEEFLEVRRKLLLSGLSNYLRNLEGR